jgi:hypothetical protein
MEHISVGLASQVLDIQSKSTFLSGNTIRHRQRLPFQLCYSFSQSTRVSLAVGIVELSRGGAEVWQEMDRRVMSDSTTFGFAPRSKVEPSMWDRLSVFALVETFDGRFALFQGSLVFCLKLWWWIALHQGPFGFSLSGCTSDCRTNTPHRKIPTALADHVEKNNLQGQLKYNLFVGASSGAETENRWARLNMIERRSPHQVGKEIAKGINNGNIKFFDKHLSMFPVDLMYG